MNKIREKRQRLGLSQEELARLTGIPRTTISAIESGKAMPSVDYAIRLARALRCSVEELFSEEVYTPFPNFEEGLFVSYSLESRRILVPINQVESLHEPEGYYKRGNIEWFNVKPIPTYAFAGCDPSFKLVSEYLKEEGIRLIVLNLSSLKALELLKSGLVHMAGVHMGTFEENVSLAKDLLGRGYKVIKVFSWEEGIALRERLPIKELKDKLWLAREEGSGARRVFERLRSELHIENHRVISGGHRDIVYCLREGLGDAGVTTKASALEYGLEFISFSKEDYCLCYKEELEEDRSFRKLLEFLRSKTHSQMLSYLPGYEKKSFEEVLT